MKTLSVTAAMSAVLVLASCGGDAGDDPEADASSAAPAPEPVAVTVDLRDEGSLNLLFNGSAGKCTSVNIAALLTEALDNGGEVNEDPARPTVTLRDAAGEIVGTQELPKRGGVFDRATGCEWSIDFDEITPSDFYEVEISLDQQSYTATGPRNGQPIEVEF